MSLGHVPINLTLRSPFRFPDLQIRRFLDTLRAGHAGEMELTTVRNADAGWVGDPPATFIFTRPAVHYPQRKSPLIISVGRCYYLGQGQDIHHTLWANAHCDHEVDENEADTAPRHACPADHIYHWPSRTKSFISGPNAFLYCRKAITLSFKDCPFGVMPGTLVLCASFKQLNQDSINWEDGHDVAERALRKRHVRTLPPTTVYTG